MSLTVSCILCLVNEIKLSVTGTIFHQQFQLQYAILQQLAEYSLIFLDQNQSQHMDVPHDFVAGLHSNQLYVPDKVAPPGRIETNISLCLRVCHLFHVITLFSVRKMTRRKMLL